MEPCDEELVSSCRSGSLAAFNTLYERHREAIYRYCYRMVGDADDADDLTQEAFVRAHRGLPRFRGECRFATWLYRIASNLCIERLRARRTPAVLSLDGSEVEAGALASPPGADPAVMVARRLTAEAVQRALAALPPHHRAVLVLRDVEELSYAEVAQALACSVAAVKIRLHRARKALRRALPPQWEDEG